MCTTTLATVVEGSAEKGQLLFEGEHADTGGKYVSFARLLVTLAEEETCSTIASLYVVVWCSGSL